MTNEQESTDAAGATTASPPTPPKASDFPRYRIRAVAEMTGVATATLRAWERRYGVPGPARSQARYRLFSERDIAVIRNMSSLCETGMRPAEAAEIVKSERARSPKFPIEPSEVRAPALVDDMLASILANEFEGLRARLDLAFASQSAAAAYDQHISPLLARIGQSWAAGTMSIAQEHLASFTIRTLCAHYLRLVSPSQEAPAALLACADDEPHEIGLLGFGLHVAAWGFRPIMLGARVPVEALAESIAVHRPAFVGISVVLAPRDPEPLFAAYARACEHTPWVVGGPAASTLAATVKALDGHVLHSPADDSLEPLLARWFRAHVAGGPLSAAVRTTPSR